MPDVIYRETTNDLGKLKSGMAYIRYIKDDFHKIDKHMSDLSLMSNLTSDHFKLLLDLLA